MEFVVFTNVLAVLMIIFSLTPTISITPPPNYPVAKPHCVDRCGNISIPYPFGTTKECYQHYSFMVTCNHTFNPPKLFMQNTTIEITDISADGQLKILKYIAHECYARNGSRVYYNDPRLRLPEFLTVNNTANKFTIVGCDTYGYAFGRRLNGRNYTTGCTAMCDSVKDLETGSCMGLGCCQTSIPEDVSRLNIELHSYSNHTDVWDFNNCSYAFIVEETAFTFSPESLTNLRNVEKLPMVVDWAIGNETCERAQMNSSSYACLNINSTCYEPSNGDGYRCRCKDGYEGNPYLIDGCRDRDECAVPSLHNCKYGCVNTVGGFHCPCPKGYRGNGTRGGDGCTRGQSLMLRLVAGTGLGVIVLLLSIWCLYLELKRRKLNRNKQKFFLQNGGAL